MTMGMKRRTITMTTRMARIAITLLTKARAMDTIITLTMM
jgi:hypothetical protein